MKTKVGDLVKIRFYDHSVGIADKMTCEAIGWVTENNKSNIVITSWRVITKDKEIADNNMELSSIIKSCIIKIRVIK